MGKSNTEVTSIGANPAMGDKSHFSQSKYREVGEDTEQYLEFQELIYFGKVGMKVKLGSSNCTVVTCGEASMEKISRRATAMVVGVPIAIHVNLSPKSSRCFQIHKPHEVQKESDVSFCLLPKSENYPKVSILYLQIEM
jgi:hypothetical protein